MRPLGRIVAALLALATLASAQLLSVGTASAAAGQKATGYIKVPAGSDPGTDIPVVVFHGAHPGPTLALVSGAHGTEYASIIALERLIPRIDPAELSGNVIIVPLLNLPSFQRKVPHVNPVDNKSMNRFYPGNPNGTQTDRALYAMTKEVVEKCDYLIDYHGGDLDEDLRPYSYWSITGDKRLDAASHEMVLAFGLDTVIVVNDRPKDPNASRYLDATAATRGKPAIAVEAGHAGTTEPEDIRALVDGTLSVMRQLKMLPGAPTTVAHPTWIGKVDTVSGTADGIFYPLVKRGQYVTQGAKLGYVTDYFGNKLYDAVAPANGVVLYVCSVPTMKKDDTIANVGEVVAESMLPNYGEGAGGLADLIRVPKPGIDGHIAGSAAQASGPQVVINDPQLGPIYRVGGGVVAPKAIFAPDPEYTDAARKAHVSGTVVAEVIVGPDGRVAHAKVVRSLRPDLDEQALKAIHTWTLQPATLDGKPVAVQVNIETMFRIE